MNRLTLVGLVAALAMGACTSTLQTTSGADYLARYDASHEIANGVPTDVDEDVRRIAAIEPTLIFPARIGLARIQRGTLTAMPADEAKIWQSLAEELGTEHGELIPVSPLIASMVREKRPQGMDRSAAVIADIRRGAARQHLDYVLAYEVSARRQEKANALAIADLTIIGLLVLPSRTIEVEAAASGLMLDVRTGYPYASLTTYAEKSGMSRVVSEYSTGRAYIDTAEEQAVAELATEFGAALNALAEHSLTLAEAG